MMIHHIKYHVNDMSLKQKQPLIHFFELSYYSNYDYETETIYYDESKLLGWYDIDGNNIKKKIIVKLNDFKQQEYILQISINPILMLISYFNKKYNLYKILKIFAYIILICCILFYIIHLN